MTTQPTGGRPPDRREFGDIRRVLPPPLPGARTAPAQGQNGPAGDPNTGGRTARRAKSATGLHRAIDPRRLLGKVPLTVSHLGRVGRVTAYTVLPLCLLVVMACGALYVRLKHGPIALDSVVPPVERGINAELSHNSVDIKGAEIRLGPTGGIEFRLRNVTVYEEHGDAVAVAPLAAVTISTAALWRLRVVPERIELIDPQISLAYTDEAGLVLDPPQVKRRAPVDATSDDKSAAQSETPVADPPPVASNPNATTAEPYNLNLAKMISDASSRARRRVGATSYMTEFGIRNATVAISYAGKKSAWTVAEASVDFDHSRKRSVISGRAIVEATTGPWTVSFRTDENEKDDRLSIKANIRDLVPSSLAAAAPPLALMKPLNVPLAGDATILLSTAGDVETAELALEVGEGHIDHSALKQPLAVNGGLFRLTFNGAAREWQLAPSPLKWAEGSILFTGAMRDTATGDAAPPTWSYILDGKNGVMEAPQFNVAPVALDVWRAEGAIVPRRGVIDISQLRIAGGGGEAVLKGTSVASQNGQSTKADVTLSAMPLATLKALWPVMVAPGARVWVGENVTAADFKGGTIRFESGQFVSPGATTRVGGPERLSVAMEFADATFTPYDGMAPITAPRGLVQVENDVLDIAVPDAVITLSNDRKVPIKAGRLYSPNIIDDRSDGEISLTTQSDLGPFLEVVEQLPVRAVQEATPFPKAGDGKVDGQFTIKLPLISGINADDVRIEGKAKISDGRFGKVGGQFDVQGFTLNLDLTATSLDAKGDLLVNGVPAKITAQRVFGVGSAEQPPVRVTAMLDDADRRQLGLDSLNVIQGTVPVEVSLQSGIAAEPVIKIKADLTSAELRLDKLAWKKASGRAASFETEVVKGKQGNIDLQKFKVSGDDIAVDGWVSLGADNKPKEFLFPTFALNVVSRLQVQGVVSSDKSWSIKANGPTFDARDLFRSWFSVGDSSGQSAAAATSTGGVNISVEIGNVLGSSDVSLRGLRLKLATRGDKLVALDARGTLDGGAPVAAVLDQSDGRRLMVDCVDGGQLMRLINFYPNMQGGRLRLEVNLEGKGAADKTGVLWVDQFKVLGDPVVSEVVGSVEKGGSQNRKNVTREVFEFDKMRAPFSVGYGQFVLEDSYLKGPLVGATIRGKVDFKTRKINIGGTYVPLQGLNGAFGAIPVLGQLISGVQGEGIFGITFAVQGPLAEPQVLVNPLSLVTPGIFREMFQMTGANPTVQAREDKPQAKPASERVRANSPPILAEPRSNQRKQKEPKATRVAPKELDGWSSTTSKEIGTP